MLCSTQMCQRFLIAFILSTLTLSATPRAHSWKPEARPGSARLLLTAIQSLVLPPQPSDALQAAAKDLQTVWLERVGTSLELVQLESAAGERQAVLPKSAIVVQRLPVRRFADWQGYSVAGSFSIARQRSRVTLRSPSDNGLSNALYALCTEMLGARWYWPEAIGLEYVGAVPRHFPERPWREAPVFVQRRLYPMENDYGRRNRLVSGYRFNHALAKVFTPELFAREPELFAEVYGARRAPSGSGKYDPQPDLTHPRAVQWAAQAAWRHFQDHPTSRSFSLSINDNCYFDDSARTAAALGPVRYFRSRPNYTDLVFGFMNQVAEALEALQAQQQDGASGAELWRTPAGEDRYLTALAYYWAEQSPSIPLHPNVMPVLTSDRAQWHDPNYRAEDRALIERWANSGASRIATWDYYFGAPLPYPRQFNQWLMESLQHLAANRVSVFFSQLPSAWGLDGAKAWLAAELLWDPWQDGAALLEEYYTQFFGAAASSMRAFYTEAEAHRNAHAGKAEWIKYYKDEAGVALFTPEVLARLRACLERAKLAVADDSRRLARVQVVSDAFAFTELQAAYQQARATLLEACFANRVTGSEVTALIQARAAFEAYGQALVADPLHARLQSFMNVLQSDPVPIAIAALARTGAAIEFEGAAEYADAIAAAKSWAAGPQRVQSLLPNAALHYADPASQARSFLPPHLPRISDWRIDFRPAEQLQFAPVGSSAEGPSGLRVSGADAFSMATEVQVQGEARYLLECRLAYRVSPDDRIQLTVRWLDREGQRLRFDYPLQVPVGASAGEQRIHIPFQAPPGAHQARIHFRVSRQYPGDFLELRHIDFGALQP